MEHIRLPHDHGQKMEEIAANIPDAERFAALA